MKAREEVPEFERVGKKKSNHIKDTSEDVEEKAKEDSALSFIDRKSQVLQVLKNVKGDKMSGEWMHFSS